MVAPIDYTLNVKSPFEAAVQGYGLGANMAQMQAQREATMAQRDAEQAKADQARAALARQEEAQAATRALFDNPNPTAQDFVRVASMLPEKEAASMRSNWELMNKDRQDNTLKFSGQVLSAFNSGSPEIGTKLLMDRAEAERNAGNVKEADAYETWAKIAEANPQAAMKSLGIMVAQVPGGDKVIESVTKIGAESRAEAKAPAELKEANAKAEKAAVDARFAESNAVQEIEKRGWDIKKLQSDIQINKENARIAAVNASIAREGNQLKKQELGLKLQEMTQKRDDIVRTKVAEATSARATIDNAVNTVEKILKNPALKDVIGSFEGRMPEAASMFDDQESDAIAAINTLGSQAFLTAVAAAGSMSGLTEKEGEKLQNSAASLTRAQSEKSFDSNLKEFQRLMLKARANLTTKYGVPETIPDTPEAAPTPEETNALLKKYGGR